MPHRNPQTLAVLVGTASLLAAGLVGAGEPKHAPAKVERIEGTPLSRVTLTEQAAVRIGIATVEMREMAAVRKRVVPGLATEAVAIVTTVAGVRTGGAAPVDFDQAVQRVEVQPVGELDKTARVRPARVLSSTGANKGNGWQAEPAIALAVLESVKNPDGPLVFEVHGAMTEMPASGPVFVELALSDDGIVRKVAPYDAVLYDIRGATWVYTNPEPLVFVRHSVIIEYIDKGLAVLTEGPPSGTAIVSVGVAELYGTEFKIGK